MFHDEKHPGIVQVMADLQDQIAARRKPAAGSTDGSILQIGVDGFLAELPRNAAACPRSTPRERPPS